MLRNLSTIKEVFDNKEKYLTQERLDSIKRYWEIVYIKKEIERYKDPRKFTDSTSLSIDYCFKQKDFSLQKVFEICDK